MNHHSHTLPPRPAPSLFFRSVMKLYSIFSVGAIPLFWIIAKKRLNAKKEDPKKVQHRFGITNVQRPKGPIIWLHAASIGETRMALSIAYKILQDHEKSYILITTQTLGAQTIVENIPRIIHQMAPFDSRVYVKRFFLYWRPSCAFILESERWPNLLYEAFKHHIPLIGINTHVSEKSLRRWSILKLFFSELLGLFSVCFTPSKKIKEYLMHASFGKGLIHLSPSLKYVLPSTVCANTHSPEKFSSVWSKKKSFFKGHLYWLASCIHVCEIPIILKIQKNLSKQIPNLLLILIPRHPDRFTDFPKNTAYRSKEDCILEKTSLYVVDTFGETQKFYQSASFCVLGGSITPEGGGHNLIEPVAEGCAVIHGPYFHHCPELYSAFIEKKASYLAKDVQTLTKIIQNFLIIPQNSKIQSQRAYEVYCSTQEEIHSYLDYISSICKEIIVKK